MKIQQIGPEEIATRNNTDPESVRSAIDAARKSMIPVRKEFRVKERGKERKYVIIRHGVGSLKTPYGSFWLFNFFVNDQWKLYSVIVGGELTDDFMSIWGLFGGWDEWDGNVVFERPRGPSHL